MERQRSVLIACPHYQVLVRGTYPCGADGRYLLAADGAFVLERLECGRRGGRCSQTLCALHHLNRGGVGSWFPARIMAVGPAGGARRQRAGGAATRAERRAPETGTADLLC